MLIKDDNMINGIQIKQSKQIRQIRLNEFHETANGYLNDPAYNTYPRGIIACNICLL